MHIYSQLEQKVPFFSLKFAKEFIFTRKKQTFTKSYRIFLSEKLQKFV